MVTETERLKSFDCRWPYGRIRTTPKQISKAGLYFSGEEDKCVCFYCGWGIKKWDFNDNPWFEHARISPK